MPIYLCKRGHMHKAQWRADNCAECKRNARRREQRLPRMMALTLKALAEELKP